MVNVGLIGCGFIAQKHVQALCQLDDFKVRAFADPDDVRLRALFDIYFASCSGAKLASVPKMTSDYMKILEDPAIDVVVVSLPSGLHGSVAQSALMNGKHVIVEKPLALSVNELTHLQTLSEKTGKQLAVCHQKRFYPHLREIKNLLQNGVIGRVVLAEMALVYNRNPEYYSNSSWRGTWLMDGGMLLNQAVHNVDMLVWLLGAPVVVHGTISRQLRAIETEDTAAAVFTMPNGSLATIAATVCAQPSTSFERLAIYGTEGWLVLSGKRFEHYDVWSVPGFAPPSYQDIDPYISLYRDFKQAVDVGSAPENSLSEAIRTTETIMAVYQSQIQGAAVRLPLAQFSTADMVDNFQGDANV